MRHPFEHTWGSVGESEVLTRVPQRRETDFCSCSLLGSHVARALEVMSWKFGFYDTLSFLEKGFVHVSNLSELKKNEV